MGSLYDEEEAPVILELVGTEDNEAETYEWIFWKTSFIYSILFILVENDVKAAVNEALVESSDVDAVLGIELEENNLSVAGWYDGLLVPIGDLVTTNP